MSKISPARKRHKSSAHENVDAALYEWFKEKRNQNFPISEPILMAKSETSFFGSFPISTL
jgi:hypothetical protein